MLCDIYWILTIYQILNKSPHIILSSQQSCKLCDKSHETRVWRDFLVKEGLKNVIAKVKNLNSCCVWNFILCIEHTSQMKTIVLRNDLTADLDDIIRKHWRSIWQFEKGKCSS
jgi:hypothetical protein